jgi:hypothetical protein
VSRLLGAQAVDVAKDDRGTHAGRQLTEGPEDAPAQLAVFGLWSDRIGWLGPGSFMTVKRPATLVDERIHQRSAYVAVQMHRPNAGPREVEPDQALLDEVLRQVRIAPGESGTGPEKRRPPIRGEGPKLFFASVHDGMRSFSAVTLLERIRPAIGCTTLWHDYETGPVRPWAQPPLSTRAG